MTAVSPKAAEYELDDAKFKLDTTVEGQVVEADWGTVERIELNEKESQRVLRKIDWHLMPLMCVVYGLQFVSDLHLSIPWTSRCIRARIGSLTRDDILARQNLTQLCKVGTNDAYRPGRSLCAAQ